MNLGILCVLASIKDYNLGPSMKPSKPMCRVKNEVNVKLFSLKSVSLKNRCPYFALLTLRKFHLPSYLKYFETENSSSFGIAKFNVT